MPTEKKRQAVDSLAERLTRSTIVIASGFRGLTVGEMTELRRKLRQKGIEYKVVKNTLAFIASERAGKAPLKEVIQGPTGLALGYADPVEVAKAFVETTRSLRLNFDIKGGLMDGRPLSARDVNTLVTIPPKEELLARLFAQMNTPIYRLVNALAAVPRGLVTVLNARAEQLKAQG